MPLVKGGQIADDIFVHVTDGAELPDDAAVLIPVARFLESPEGVLQRKGKTGVIWPNSRDVDDLAPYLDRLAAVALVFPTFRDGRAYSQARLLRERFHYRGELRATGQVLRDQFVFMGDCQVRLFRQDIPDLADRSALLGEPGDFGPCLRAAVRRAGIFRTLAAGAW